MINGVSFGTSASFRGMDSAKAAVSPNEQKLNDLINERSPYSTDTMAASDLKDNKPKKKGMSGITKTIIGLGAVAGALALARGKFDSIKAIEVGTGIKNQTGILNKAKYAIAAGGEYVLKGWRAVAGLFSKGAKGVEQAAEAVVENGAK